MKYCCNLTLSAVKAVFSQWVGCKYEQTILDKVSFLIDKINVFLLLLTLNLDR